MDYKEKLKDRRWRDRRRQILVRDNYECQSCRHKYHSNDVHHIAYVKGWEPWDYPDEYLLTLCRSCHDNEHYIENKLKEMRLSGLLWSDIANKIKLKI